MLKFPKIERYSLGQELQNESLELIRVVISASKTDSLGQKLEYLEVANSRLEIVKLLVRLSSDVNAITDKRYLGLQSILQEIGKMLGGWIKSLKK